MAIFRAIRNLCSRHLVKLIVIGCFVWGLACLLVLAHSTLLASSAIGSAHLYFRMPVAAAPSLPKNTPSLPKDTRKYPGIAYFLDAGSETVRQHVTPPSTEQRTTAAATGGTAGRGGVPRTSTPWPQDSGAPTSHQHNNDANYLRPQSEHSSAGHHPGVTNTTITTSTNDTANSQLAVDHSSSGRHRSALSYTKDGSAFLLGGKPFRILSGELHYFRIVPDYWEDRLRRLAAAGLNTVSTYVAWNLHEPRPGVFRFRKGSRTDLQAFIRLAHRLGLYVVLRPGPYICAEWEFGGLPAWLLREYGTELRTNGRHYMRHVRRYLKRIYEETSKLQHAYGGPIIAVQIENEYGTFANNRPYLAALHTAALEGGIVELLFKCDDNQGLGKNLVQLPGVLQTVNSNSRMQFNLAKLRSNQQHRAPIFVAEFWTGWYSVFGYPVAGHPETKLLHGLAEWLDSGASVNFYMWHGGSNFYYNGAVENPYRVVTTSYDYDSPVSENGTLTSKFYSVRNMLRRKVGKQVVFGAIPPPIPVRAYGTIPMSKFATLDTLVAMAAGAGIHLQQVCPMEQLPITATSGQSTGWTLYRHSGVLPANRVTTNTNAANGSFSLRIPSLADFGVVRFNGEQIGHAGYKKPATFTIPTATLSSTAAGQLDILVAHLGRNNYLPTGQEQKGLLQPVTVDSTALTGWTVFPIEFSDSFMLQLASNASIAKYLDISPWQLDSNASRLLFVEFSLNGEKPCDTYLRVDEGLGSGVVVLNGEILGRYNVSAAHHALYTPAPLLRSGINTIILLELERVPAVPAVTFVDRLELRRR